MIPTNTLMKAFELTDPSLGFLKAVGYSNEVEPATIQPFLRPLEQALIDAVFGQELWADFRAVRTTLEYKPNVNPMFPTNADYNDFWEELGFSYYAATLTYRAQIRLNSQTGDAGNFDKTGDKFKATSPDNRKSRALALQDDVETLRAATVRYLCDNKDKFPIWRDSDMGKKLCGCECSHAQPRKKNPFIHSSIRR